MPDDTTPRFDTERDLAFDIAYALRKVPELRAKPGRPDPCPAAALAVIAHLKLARWAVTKLPPIKAHTIP